MIRLALAASVAAGIMLISAGTASSAGLSAEFSAGFSAAPNDVSLSGWKLTLPVANSSGSAETVNPAAITSPWLTRDSAGDLVFWAPTSGATTPNSTHARTELVDLTNWSAGESKHVLKATVEVTQVPTTSKEIIIGQIHGAGDIDSSAWILLEYNNGTVKAIVNGVSGSFTLLTDVPLSGKFSYGITDGGNNKIVFTASYGSTSKTTTVAVPSSWQGADVRFQAGDYQQDTHGEGSSTNGGRVTFTALSIS